MRQNIDEAVAQIISESRRRAALAPRKPGKDRSTAARKGWETMRSNIAQKIKAGEIKVP